MKRRPQPGGALRVVGSAALAKVIVMGLSGVLGVLTSRLIISHFGTEAYAQYGLLATIPTLLPFADLGIAAVVLNTIAASAEPRSDPAVRRTVTTAFRILLVAGGVIGLTGVVISLLGAWPVILGDGLVPGSGPAAALICLLIFGLVLPLTVGQRVLVGLNRTTSQVLSQSVVAPFVLLTVFTAVALTAPIGSYLAVISYVGNALVSVICLVVAARALSPQLRAAIRDIPRLRAAPSVPVLGIAWPMLVQMIALPVAMQTDRVLLSQMSTVDQLAQYNLAAQLFGLVLQTIAAAGVALWPIYAKARSEAKVQSPTAPTVWFLIGGTLLGGILAALSPWLVLFISDGRITLDPWLVGGFVVFVALQAAKYPLGMYMTDKRGLRFQVVPILIMVPLSLGLSIALIGGIGAGGAILGSAVAVGLCQVVPNLLYVRRDLARRRVEQESREDDPAAVLS